jgi:hypothetical protein
MVATVIPFPFIKRRNYIAEAAGGDVISTGLVPF